MKKTPSLHAFTLVELLVSMGIILTLAMILIPVIGGAIEKAKMTTTLANGQSVYKALFSNAADVYNNDEDTYPSSEVYDNSTDYFTWMITNQVIDVTYDFFAAGRIKPYKGARAEEFEPRHNAWCITADLSVGSRNNTPLLFTRNLNIDRLDQTPYSASLTNSVFESRMIMINHGGAGVMLDQDSIDITFNPWEAKNVVLRP